MRDGLRSGKIRAKLEKDKVLASPSRALAHDTPQKCSDLTDPFSPSPSKALFQKKEDDTMQKGFDLNDPVPVQKDSESVKGSLGIKFEEKMNGSKGDEYGNAGMGEVVGLTENRSKRRRVDSGEDIEENGAEKKRGKMDGLDCKEHIVGWVLRSRSGGEMTSNKSESKGSVVAGKRTQEKNGSGKKMVNVEMDESDRQVQRLKTKLKRERGRPPKVHTSNVISKEDEGDRMVGNSKMKMKRKRGRPFKVHTSNVVSKEDEGDGMVGNSEKKMKRKRGRPFKVHTSNVVSKEDEGDGMVGNSQKKMKRKRGRPFKVHTSNVVSKGDEGDRMVGNPKKKMMKKRGRPFKVHGSIGVSEKESGKEEIVGSLRKSERAMKLSDNVKQMQDQLMPKEVSPAEENKYGDLETEDTEDSSRLRSKGANTVSSKKKIENEGGKFKQNKRDAKCSRSATKQLVRDRIVKLLLSAGWTIDYRPRNGREYNDAVYVNPEGRTHWSVTLAYRMFIKQYEDGDHDSKTTKSSSAFTPIPEEELSMLKRVTQKKLGSKKLKQSRKGGKKTEKKRHKESLTPVVNSGGKLLKGRLKGKPSLCEQGNSTVASAMGMPVPVRNRKRLETQNRKRCALLARSSMKGAESDNEGYILYSGKRTVLSWMIDMGTIPLNGKVQYMNERKPSVMLEGKITRDGIHCDCCSQIFTISDFETHAGSKLCQPFQNIFLETGASLLLCQLDSWNKQEEFERKWFHFVDFDGEDPNDDTCGLCGDGGDLICCDGCPSTFHQNCLDIQNFPSGDWHCIYCSCKFCGMVGRSTYQRDDNDDTTVSALLTCCLCEEKYHKLCIRSRDAADDDPNSPSFCGMNCREIFERLQMLLGVKHELEEGFSWSFIQRCNSEIHQKIECNSKLAVALSVMDECFLPIFDHRSGVNLIRNILYNCGSNFNRLNYSGFFTAILERGDEIISVASIRIRGNQLAEMPFIGTRHMYRRQRMCSRLLAAIESGLYSLNVGKLVIPAISELRQTWTSVFGFKPIEVSEKKEMRNMNMLVFPGVDMLHKPLLSHPEEVISPSAGTNCSDPIMEHQMMNDVANNCDDSSSEGNAHAHKINDDPTDIKTDSQLPDGSSHDTSEITSETVILTECAADIKCSVQMSSSHDTIEGESKTIMNNLGCACNDPKLSEEINEHQTGVSCSIGLASDKNTIDCQLHQHKISELKRKSDVVPCVGSAATKCEGQSVLASGEGTESVACEVKREDSIVEHVCCSIGSTEKSLVEPDSHLNQHNISELKDKADMVSCIGSTAPKCEEQFVLASREGTGSVACEMKGEDRIVKKNSGDKGSLEHSEEFITTQPQDSHIGCKDLETISWMSQDAKDDEHHNSQQFPLTVVGGHRHELEVVSKL